MQIYHTMYRLSIISWLFFSNNILCKIYYAKKLSQLHLNVHWNTGHWNDRLNAFTFVNDPDGVTLVLAYTQHMLQPLIDITRGKAGVSQENLWQQWSLKTCFIALLSLSSLRLFWSQFALLTSCLCIDIVWFPSGVVYEFSPHWSIHFHNYLIQFQHLALLLVHAMKRICACFINSTSTH